MRRLLIFGVGILLLSGCLHVATPEEAARMQAFGRALQGAGGALRSASPTDAPYSPPMTCFKTGEVVSGMNKICTYNCAGSAAARTIGAADICPLTIG